MPNWLFYGQDPEAPRGRRYLAIALATAGLSACEAAQNEFRVSEDAVVQQARHYQNRETGMCVVILGSGNVTTISPVACTPEILSKVYRP